MPAEKKVKIIFNADGKSLGDILKQILINKQGERNGR